MRKRVRRLVTMTIAGWLSVLLPLFMSVTVQAASLDCDKATTRVEKLICDNPVISKLDNELNAVYKTVLDKANEKEKQNLVTQQRHWLKHTRNVCETEVCFKHAYWSRQAELSAFFQPKPPFYAKESDKAEAIQKVLATAPLYPSTQSDPPLCRQLLADLKDMKGIQFVDPVVQTMSYEDPALDTWKQQFCEQGGVGRPFNFSYGCDLNFSGDDIDSELQECRAGYGLPPYKIFELPPLMSSGQIRYFFYSNDSYGPVNHDFEDPRFGGSFSGFVEFYAGQCDGIYGGIHVSGRDEARGEDINYNSIIEYKQRYFIMMLEYKTRSYWLSIEPIDKHEVCRWTPVKD